VLFVETSVLPAQEGKASSNDAKEHRGQKVVSLGPFPLAPVAGAPKIINNKKKKKMRN